LKLGVCPHRPSRDGQAFKDNVVSSTTTIKATWGTGIVVPGHGFQLNNELTDFTFDPAYGSPGGATIIDSVFNVTLNLIDHGMWMQQAIDAPRRSVTSATLAWGPRAATAASIRSLRFRRW
jgi:gamma-glutamyltranspeptidase